MSKSTAVTHNSKTSGRNKEGEVEEHLYLYSEYR